MGFGYDVYCLSLQSKRYPFLWVDTDPHRTHRGEWSVGWILVTIHLVDCSTKHGSSYLNWLKFKSHLSPTTCVNLRKFYHLSFSFLICKLNKIITESYWAAFLFLITCVKSLYLSHSKQRSSTGIHCHRNCYRIITDFKSNAISVCSRNVRNRFLHTSQVLITSSLCLPGWVRPGFYAVLAWVIFPHWVKLKAKAGRSLAFSFLLGNVVYTHTCAVVPYLKKLSNRFL